ncbi:MAG: hypothetical protein CMQ18_01840 [Gammaproteobacteria bacterium]|jgi:hypothetical protein|nr:hypothetical protein [Gammaproteobacteria bacterium]
MRALFRWITRGLVLLLPIIGGLIWLIFFSARPALTMDAAVLSGDGSALNYCELPLLDNSGKRAIDIPKGNTPGCGYTRFPMPILSECTESLPAGAADIRGLWRGISGKVGHVERVEQCGERVVVTSSGIIHDMGPNATAGLTSNDTEGGVYFTLGDSQYCPRTSAGVRWEQAVLNFRLLGWGPVVVQRYLDGDHLVWAYADGSTTRMERLCTLPDAHIYPAPRGPRIKLF